MSIELYGRLAIHHIRRRRRGGAALAAVSVMGLALAIIVDAALLGGTSAMALLLGMTIFASARRDPGAGGGRRARIELSEGKLQARRDGWMRQWDAHELDNGFIEAHAGGASLVLRTVHGEHLETKLDDDADHDVARSLLRALGLDARAVEITVGTSHAGERGCATGCLLVALVVGLPIPVAAVASGLMALGGDALFAAIFMVALVLSIGWGVVVALSLRALDSTQLTIGSDGVWIKRRWAARFVSYRDLDGATRRGDKLVLRTDPHEYEVRCQDGASVDAALERVRLGLQSWQNRDPAIEISLLERAGRTPQAWREHLVRLIAGAAAGYRERALSQADMWRVVEDPRAQPEHRVAAAIALSPLVQQREKLRIIANGCAHAPLRIALDHAAEGELEEEALREATRSHAP